VDSTLNRRGEARKNLSYEENKLSNRSCGWVVERSFAWTARFRHLARDDERLPQLVAGLTFLAVVCLMLPPLIHFPAIA